MIYENITHSFKLCHYYNRIIKHFLLGRPSPYTAGWEASAKLPFPLYSIIASAQIMTTLFHNGSNYGSIIGAPIFNYGPIMAQQTATGPCC